MVGRGQLLPSIMISVKYILIQFSFITPVVHLLHVLSSSFASNSPNSRTFLHSQARSEAKVVQAHKYKSVQRPQAVNNRFLAPQAQGPVGLALDVSMKSLRIYADYPGFQVNSTAQTSYL